MEVQCIIQGGYGGSLLRDHQCQLIFAFSIPLGYRTNNQAELQATIYSVKWCLQFGYKHMLLEVDSKLIIMWIRSGVQVPWQLFQFITELNEFTHQLSTFQTQHMYKEANNSVDLLTKWSHRLDENQHFYAY